MDSTVNVNGESKKKAVWKKIVNFPLVPILEVLAIGIVGSLLSQYVLYRVFIPFENEENAAVVEFLATYALTGGIVIISLLYMWLIRSYKPMLEFMWTRLKGNNLKMAFIGLLAGFGMNTLAVGAAVLNNNIVLRYTGGSIALFVLFFLAVLIQASNEEILCRCFLYHRFSKIFKNNAVGIFIASTLFGVFHIFNPGATVLAIITVILAGLAFGLLVYAFDSFWMAVTAHLGWNYSQNIIYGLPNSGAVSTFSMFKLDASTATDSLVYNVNFGVEGTLSTCVGFLLVDIALILYTVKFKKKPTNV